MRNSLTLSDGTTKWPIQTQLTKKMQPFKVSSTEIQITPSV